MLRVCVYYLLLFHLSNKLQSLAVQHQATLGSHFAPYQIEPKRWWRSRLDESLELEPMSDAQRAARRQWLADQRLAPEEPRYVPALYRRPFLSRLFTTPWDALLWPLRPIFVSTILFSLCISMASRRASQ